MIVDIIISVKLPDELEARLNARCKLTQVSKKFYIKEALSEYLEDLEDAYDAIKIMNTPNQKLYTSQEMW